MHADHFVTAPSFVVPPRRPEAAARAPRPLTLRERLTYLLGAALFVAALAPPSLFALVVLTAPAP